jgi:hypothetical protein
VIIAAGLLLGLVAAPGAWGQLMDRLTRQLTPVAAPPPPPATTAPTDPPILRIDADFHTQVVNRFAQDHGGRIIVTGSDDKTIRVWQASNGAPLATLRVPINRGDEGAIYAVAISPDDKTLLVGGNTGFAFDKAFAVYMFDLQTQRLRGRLPNLPGPINDIAYSPDGHSFALAMGNGGGVWLVDASNGSLIGSDASFRQRVTSVTFDHRGRLYATGYDGEVRLYDPTGKRLAARTPVPNARPYTVAVSPDDRTVAVGYGDQARVELLNAQDLTPKTSLANDPSGKRETGAGGLGAVAWTQDGALLAAGSLRGRDGSTIVRHWSHGSARPTDWSGLHDTIFQIGGTADGGAILVSADPAMARLDSAGRTVFHKGSPGLDFRDVSDRMFRVSSDGMSVQLQTKTMPTSWTFDLAQRRVGPPAGTRALVPIAAPPEPPAPAPTGSRPEVTDWRNNANPRIDGRPLQLAPEELSRSYAISPSGMVVLGTDYQLRVYRSDGAPLAAAELPGAAWAVGVSGDGRVVVAAVSDGTLRWFGLSDRGELTPRVALFAANDARRWVAWTQTGFFDYSDTGGTGMVGLLLNRAKNQVPDWYSFAQVYRRFYSPDTVAARLHGQQVADPAVGLDGVRQTLAQTPPPTIELRAVCYATAPGADRQCDKLAASSITRSLTPVAATAETSDVTVPASASAITLQYGLRGEAGTSAVDIFVNGHNGGRAVRDVSADGSATQEQTTPLLPGINKVQLRAYDKAQQTYAESRLVEVLHATAPDHDDKSKPNIYILAVGVNDYGPQIVGLRYAVPDAKSVAAAIKSEQPNSYGATTVYELYDKAASTTAVIKALGDIGQHATANDTVLIYFSGHGEVLDGRYYFITNSTQTVDQVTTTALSEAALLNALAGIKSNNTMLFLDTCHAGGFSLDATGKIAHESGRYILAAASTEQEALDSYDDRNGVFATAMLRVIKGQAGNGAKLVDNFDLGKYVAPMVQKLATEVAPTHQQRAKFTIEAPDAESFPIAAVPGSN